MTVALGSQKRASEMGEEKKKEDKMLSYRREIALQGVL